MTHGQTQDATSGAAKDARKARQYPTVTPPFCGGGTQEARGA
jgi:hypothetical protein